jgi:hypothetical protein
VVPFHLLTFPPPTYLQPLHLRPRQAGRAQGLRLAPARQAPQPYPLALALALALTLALTLTVTRQAPPRGPAGLQPQRAVRVQRMVSLTCRKPGVLACRPLHQWPPVCPGGVWHVARRTLQALSPAELRTAAARGAQRRVSPRPSLFSCRVICIFFNVHVTVEMASMQGPRRGKNRRFFSLSLSLCNTKAYPPYVNIVFRIITIVIH